jgi:lipid A 3-O-deacylase
MQRRNIHRTWLLACAALASALAAGGAAAMDLRPDGVAVQGGPAKHGARAVAAALVWDWDTRKERRGLFTGQTELILSHWRADALGGGSQGLQQLALVPVLRIEPDHGRSPWYLEAGIGISLLSRDYSTPDKTFSTRWNFYDVLGAGYRFGDHGQHELGLRYNHVSNAGLRKPNPGEDFLLLRYALRF